MKKMILKLTAGALGFVMIAGFSILARAENDASKDKNKDNPGTISSGTEKPKDNTDNKNISREEARKRCKELGCYFPKCFHDWSKYELNLTAEQKAKIKELKDRINKKTIGINYCTRDAAKHRLEQLKKDKNANKADIDKARAELKRINDGIKAGNKEFNDVYMNQILTAEQRKLVEARKEAWKEHQEKCRPQHNPNCPFYEKNKRKSEPNQGDYIRYCEEESHLSQGLFECPGYREVKREERREKNKSDNKCTDKPENKGTDNSKK